MLAQLQLRIQFEHRVLREEGQSENNCIAEMWSGSEKGSYLRLADGYITQLQAP